jgi:hypothetical protein
LNYNTGKPEFLRRMTRGGVTKLLNSQMARKHKMNFKN